MVTIVIQRKNKLPGAVGYGDTTMVIGTLAGDYIAYGDVRAGSLGLKSLIGFHLTLGTSSGVGTPNITALVNSPGSWFNTVSIQMGSVGSSQPAAFVAIGD